MPGNTGTQDIAQIITMGSVSNPVSANGQVWWDGTHLSMNIGGTIYRLDHPLTSAWTVTNVTPNRTFNALTATTLSNAAALGTLIQDLQSSGLVG